MLTDSRLRQASVYMASLLGHMTYKQELVADFPLVIWCLPAEMLYLFFFLFYYKGII